MVNKVKKKFFLTNCHSTKSNGIADGNFQYFKQSTEIQIQFDSFRNNFKLNVIESEMSFILFFFRNQSCNELEKFGRLSVENRFLSTTTTKEMQEMYVCRNGRNEKETNENDADRLLRTERDVNRRPTEDVANFIVRFSRIDTEFVSCIV